MHILPSLGERSLRRRPIHEETPQASQEIRNGITDGFFMAYPGEHNWQMHIESWCQVVKPGLDARYDRIFPLDATIVWQLLGICRFVIWSMGSMISLHNWLLPNGQDLDQRR